MSDKRDRMTDPELPALDLGTTQYWLSPRRIRLTRPMLLFAVVGGALAVFLGSEIVYRLRPSLEAVAPAGFCALESAETADAGLQDGVEAALAGVNARREKFADPRDTAAIEEIMLLAAFADCGQLDAFRQDGASTLDLVATVTSTRVTYRDLPVPVSRQELLEGWDDTFAGPVGNQLIRDAVNITGGLSGAPGIGQAPSGVPEPVQELRRDEFGLYRGRMNWTTAGPDPDLVAVTGITTIDGSLVMITVVDTGNRLSLGQIFDDVRAATEDMIRRNDDL